MTGNVEGADGRGRRLPDDPDETMIATRRDLARSRTTDRSHPRPRHGAHTARADEVRRALGLTALSLLLPGLGLLWTRRRMVGWIMLGVTALAAISLAIIVSSGGLVHGAAQLLTKRGLVLLLTYCIGGGLLWIAGIVLTALTTSRKRWPEQTRWLHRGLAAVLCLIVAAPAAMATRDVWVTRNAFNHIFTKRYTTNGQHVANPGAGSNPWKKIPRVNILLFGSDAGADRVKQRPDSLIVASVNTRTGDTVLVSVPRNFGHAPLPASNPLHKLYPHGFTCSSGSPDFPACGLMEGIWGVGDDHKNLFPADQRSAAGLITTRDAVEGITGLKIDYTATVDLDGFQQLVDAMGGVWVNVKADPGTDASKGIPIGGSLNSYGQVNPGSIKGYLKPGYQKLNGFKALWYSRSRVASGDDQRMRRQRCMINDLISQVNPVQMVQKFTSIMQVASKNIRIDINQDNLPAFATLIDSMKAGNMRSVNISGANNWNPDYAKIRQSVRKAITEKHNKKAPTPGKSAKPSASSPSSSSAPSTSSSSSTAAAISDTADSC